MNKSEGDKVIFECDKELKTLKGFLAWASRCVKNSRVTTKFKINKNDKILLTVLRGEK